MAYSALSALRDSTINLDCRQLANQNLVLFVRVDHENACVSVCRRQRGAAQRIHKLVRCAHLVRQCECSGVASRVREICQKSPGRLSRRVGFQTPVGSLPLWVLRRRGFFDAISFDPVVLFDYADPLTQ